eukprot:CAMPEP_0198113758 /NCGR_PEP_ID=MMETSP1442-20131203/5345_1 /TAXON_ID= /ORGANISM="Craspedostauros australis, Strain CCMP3328" /LENGTH=36 /DNA_ID= /DNA_START= /DNA_END= /DNA_ORIENTATION=
MRILQPSHTVLRTTQEYMEQHAAWITKGDGEGMPDA